jgi:hypothetical protein
VVCLGWTPHQAQPGAYQLDLPDSFEARADSVLVFSIAATYEDPCPDRACRDLRSEPYTAPEFFDLSVEVTDSRGETARLPLSSRYVLLPPLETRTAKPPFKTVLPASETVLQHIELPLPAFIAENPAFDPALLSTVRWVFDRIPEGVVVLDHIGLR